MYNQNPEHKGVGGGGAPPMAAAMSPRISFSNDFVESSRSHSHSHPHSHSNTRAAAYRDAPVSSDFEFSKSNYSMISADELFFKGRAGEGRGGVFFTDLDEGSRWRAKLDEGSRWRSWTRATAGREAGGAGNWTGSAGSWTKAGEADEGDCGLGILILEMGIQIFDFGFDFEFGNGIQIFHF